MVTTTATQADNGQPSTTTFPLFALLPTELRLEIWRLAIPGRRISFNTQQDAHLYKQPALVLVSHEARDVVLDKGRWYDGIFLPTLFRDALEDSDPDDVCRGDDTSNYYSGWSVDCTVWFDPRADSYFSAGARSIAWFDIQYGLLAGGPRYTSPRIIDRIAHAHPECNLCGPYVPLEEPVPEPEPWVRTAIRYLFG